MFVTMIALLAMTADVRHTARPAARSTAAAKTRAARYRRARAADLRAARLVRHASNRIDVTDCTAAANCAGKGGSRDRLAGATELSPDPKSAAVSETGQECSVTGSVICTNKPRTVLRAPM